MKDTKQTPPSPVSQAETPVRQSRSGLLYVCVAVCFFSTSAVFVRWSAPFSSTEVACWRLAIAAALVGVLGLLTRTRLLLKRREVPRFLCYALIPPLPFLFFISPLPFTPLPPAL